MNAKNTLQHTIPYVLGLLLIAAIGLLAQNFVNLPALQLAPALSGNRAAAAADEPFDSERAAEISTMRWEAMGRFYEAQGMLTRDNFDYAQAADNLAYRWQAMAAGYERLGLLNDRMAAGDVMAYRWEAVARGYERLGLLND